MCYLGTNQVKRVTLVTRGVLVESIPLIVYGVTGLFNSAAKGNAQVD